MAAKARNRSRARDGAVTVILLIFAFAFMSGEASGESVWVQQSPTLWLYMENGETVLGGIIKPECNPLAPDSGITEMWRWFLAEPTRNGDFIYGGIGENETEAKRAVEEALLGLRFV